MLVSIVTLWALFALIKQSGDGREGSHGGLEEPPYAAEPQNNREPPADPLSRGEQGFWVSFDKCTQPLPTRRSQQQVLNLLSERDHQLNCRLVEAALAACGLSYRSHTIVFGFVQGNLTVTIDGRRRPAQAKGGRGPGAAEMPVVYEMLDQPLVAYSAGVNRLLTNL
ncbi:hypothetical protein WJX72_008082 [[Myrmecia] bisecta]|uniref:Uncharacterized protein n=1 Tax=[Myrmecia] bisecta TaxID=41462 RepID=A0AAW1R8F7_9CHLO